MPILPTEVGPSIQGTSSGFTVAIGKIGGPSSYAAGGFAADIADLGLESIYKSEVVLVFADKGYMADYDLTNKKIKVYATNTTTGLPTEVSNGTNLSAVTFNVVIFYVAK